MADNINILIVDDDAQMAKLIAQGLGRQGYACSIAHDAQKALEICEQRRFELVITDVRMPGIDGLALTKVIREKYDADVIVISGYLERADFNAIMESGASDFIEKPVNLGELQFRIRRVIRERNTLRDVEQAQNKFRNLSLRTEDIREKEKALLAGEIHDEFGQTLVALKFDLTWIKKKLTNPPRSISEKIESVLDLVDNLGKKTKDVITELRPAVLDHFGLCSAIEWQRDYFENKTGMKCALDIRIKSREEDFGNAIATALFRILQESLSNVVRHANASAVKISLEESNGILFFIIEDNGKGFQFENNSDTRSFGLMGMDERAQSLGGKCDIVGTPGHGTRVKVSVPIISQSDNGNIES